MKVLATLGLTLASSTAFGGLVYVATPVVEELCGLRFSSPVGVGFSGSYFGGVAHLDLRSDGTYTLGRNGGEASVAWSEAGTWALVGEHIRLRSAGGGERRLLVGEHGNTLSDASESFHSYASLTALCGYGR